MAAPPNDAAAPPPPTGPDTAAAGGFDRIHGVEIDRELHESYLTYAMSTIVDRALPDVRDGLKPSQRRILVAMNDLKLAPGKKHIKCAKICGDTSGNYHPHGESVVYPTLVNLGQDWKTRTLLIDKQGNFGSIEGDPPAAMRYTEARMTAAAVAMLEDLDQETVDFKPNYDDRLMEPCVLPGKFPNLLVNGSTGIAVGMASSMPPHNLGEICDAIVAVIDDPAVSAEDLMRIVPGPDFPTGGTIMGRSGIVEAYTTGRGRISVQGRVERSKQGDRDVLTIVEIPYQVVQGVLIEKIVEAVKTKRIEEIAEVQNHSGRDARTRIRIVLKRGADPAVVERQLYEFTPLRTTFSIINIALVNGQPRTLPFRALVDRYLDHRREVIRRRTQFQLRQAKQKAHRLEGLIYAVCDIDEVIRIIRSSRTREEAIERLQARAFRIGPDHPRAAIVPPRLITAGEGTILTRVQAEAIGALRLIQLVGLEIEQLAAELARLHEEIEGYERILADERLVLDIIREDCVAMKESFATPRLTVIEQVEADEFEMGALIAEHEAVVVLSHAGYVKRMRLETFEAQGRGGMGIKGAESDGEDPVAHMFVSSSHDDLLCFTDTGRVFLVKVWQVPEASRTGRGRAIVNLLALKEGEKVRTLLPVHDFEANENYLVFASEQGKVKRTSLKDYRNVNRSGIIAIGLNEGDRLMGVLETTGSDHLLLATRKGMAIRFHEDDARVMGRAAAGVRGIDLDDDDALVGCVRCVDGADLLTATANGYGKRTDLREYLVQCDDGSTRVQDRGGKGRKDIQTSGRNGPVVAVRAVTDADDLLFISEGGKVVRTHARDVSRIGRNTQGVRLVRLKDGDSLAAVSVAPFVEGGAEPVPEPDAPAAPGA